MKSLKLLLVSIVLTAGLFVGGSVDAYTDKWTPVDGTDDVHIRETVLSNQRYIEIHFKTTHPGEEDRSDWFITLPLCKFRDLVDGDADTNEAQQFVNYESEKELKLWRYAPYYTTSSYPHPTIFLTRDIGENHFLGYVVDLFPLRDTMNSLNMNCLS